MTDSTNRTDERRAADGESRAASWGAAPTEAGPAVARPGTASSFRTFVVAGNVAPPRSGVAGRVRARLDFR